MYIDKLELSNKLGLKYSRQIMGLMRTDFTYGELRDIVVRIGLAALKLASDKRAEREGNIDIDEYDIVTDQRDEDGFRRYACKCSDDEPLMLPDKSGLWMQVRDIKDIN